MTYQTKLRTCEITPNENICFPIGTILAVKNKYEKLHFSGVFEKYKKKGRDLNSLIQALLSYKLTENLSISKASEWINRGQVLDTFNLEKFEEKTLFRVLEIIGKNREEIIADIQDRLFLTYKFEHTDINLDWTSLVLYGDKSKLGKYGYSRDHRPDKKQITVGISELSSPINVPTGITVNKGNLHDTKHFIDTYQQIKNKLKPGSRITFDKGAHSKNNIGLILADKMKYLTSKKLNKSDDKRIKEFDKSKAELVDDKKGVYGIKFVKPSSIDYFYFSENLQKDQLKSRARKALQKLKEAKEIQKSIDNKKQLPKKFRINNVLIDISYSYQTKLEELSEEEAMRLLEKIIITGREGFFCIKSSENLTLQQALQTYRKKDSIEKIFNSMKNEIEIKPVRVWSEDSIYGALIIGFLAQLFISLIRYEIKELKNTSTKFIKNSLMNLTVTVNFRLNKPIKYIYANFDPINRLILVQNVGIT
ncbi:MAG: IS1634 family transposase [Candidatus Methanoperedens sp.]|nr:IS1634 family transposase [Candidatus Methanoperedens sp.]MDJ1422674.1 IS1634 family transposase [Candidatus Methanoperedens sp.]MDJ1423023.1 IS1634 family transposase [Candidatus Methanoperedens sp.]MDJ1423700.1 IS1634 family transposase [Candidatus Methanoperedens sp.]